MSYRYLYSSFLPFSFCVCNILPLPWVPLGLSAIFCKLSKQSAFSHSIHSVLASISHLSSRAPGEKAQECWAQSFPSVTFLEALYVRKVVGRRIYKCQLSLSFQTDLLRNRQAPCLVKTEDTKVVTPCPFFSFPGVGPHL